NGGDGAEFWMTVRHQHAYVRIGIAGGFQALGDVLRRRSATAVGVGSVGLYQFTVDVAEAGLASVRGESERREAKRDTENNRFHTHDQALRARPVLRTIHRI